MSFSWINTITGNHDQLFFILGPCVIENEKHTLFMAEQITHISNQLGCKVIFKASFDKANRTANKSFRGPTHIDDGLRILEKVRTQFKLPIVTDIHESWQADPVGSVVDVIQIPAFLCRQTDLLVAAGKTGKIIHVKKGQFIRAEKMNSIISKIIATGNNNVWVAERGYTFGYTDLIVDMRNFAIMKAFGKPIIFDATHAVQKPGELGETSGGDRRFIPSLAAAAIVQGIAGIFMEVHNNPDQALSDGPTNVPLHKLQELLSYLIALDRWAKTKPLPELQQDSSAIPPHKNAFTCNLQL